MTTKGSLPGDPADLRHLAEQRLQEGKTEGALSGAPQDTQRLVHELEVHQIELEMQNEELVAARAEAEAGLERYTELYDFAPVGYFTLDRSGTILQANLTGAAMLALERAKLVNRRMGDLLAERTRPALEAFLEEVFDGLPRKTCEAVIPREGREPLVVEMKATCGDGKECLATLTDITERKRAEEAVIEEADRRQLLFDQAPDGMVVLDPATRRILEFNDAACRNAGYTREEFSKLSVSDLEAAETPDQTRMRIETALREGKADFETVHRTKQGTLRNVSVAVRVLYSQGRSVYFCTWRDVTDRKELEQRLLQSQKMEAIGQLAGGVAHDFRNQLTVIKGYGEMLRRRSLIQEPGLHMLAEVLKAADRSALLTGQLLAFSRRQTLEVRLVDLTELVADIGGAVAKMVGEDIRLSIVPSVRQCLLEIDPGQLQQAVINLVTNARDAMPNGGDLTIEISRKDPDDVFRRKHPEVSRDIHAAVSVVDTGCGMDEATRARVFEPFFTTKEVGQGTGLGLAMVYGFVTQSGGAIEVESQPGQGSRFTMYFPEFQGNRSQRQEETAGREIAAGGTETILIVEDEEPVRRMLVEVLRESGYVVQEAGTAAEGAAQLERSGRSIDMLITDVVMPGGSGVELVRTIQAMRPDMPVLYMSGYAEKELLRRNVAVDADHMLAKPCTHEALLARIRLLLDKTKTQLPYNTQGRA